MLEDVRNIKKRWENLGKSDVEHEPISTTCGYPCGNLHVEKPMETIMENDETRENIELQLDSNGSQATTGWWLKFTPLKNMKVKWDDYFQYMEK